MFCFVCFCFAREGSGDRLFKKIAKLKSNVGVRHVSLVNGNLGFLYFAQPYPTLVLSFALISLWQPDPRPDSSWNTKCTLMKSL